MDDIMNYFPQVASDVQSVAQDTINYINSPQGQFSKEFNNILDNLVGVRDYNNMWSAYQAEVQRNWSAEEAEKNRLFNMIEAAKNREWQSIMSNTAHQRETRDLLAAGLNPILSAMGGNGAAVGSGATAAGVGNPSGSSANSDESTGMAIASILSTVLQNQTRLQEMSISAELQRELTDKQLAQNEFLSLLGFDVSRSNAITSAGAAMHAADLSYDYNIKHLNWQERSDMAWRILEKDKIAITKGDTQSQIDYRTGLLTQAGIDNETAKLIAEMYTSTTASEGAQNRGLSLFQTAINALGSAVGGLSSVIKSAS